MSDKDKKNGEVRTATIDKQSDQPLPETPITEATQRKVAGKNTDYTVEQTIFEKEKMFVLQLNRKGDAVTVYAQAWNNNPRKINIRSFYENDNGELAPTSKGVALSVSQLEKLLPHLQALLVEEKAKGTA